MISETDPRIFIIAGPNGAGKTTFANEFLPNEPQCPNFINADLIAAGLYPYHPEKAAIAAGRLMLQQIDHHVAHGENFAFETTLSGRTYLKRIPDWKEKGYKINLHFLRLDSPEQAITRVKQRVQEGGHDIPEAVIRRRFHAGWKNFQEHYRFVVDQWMVYNASDIDIHCVEKGGPS